MTHAETITILRQFNEWRLCNDEDLTQLDPKQITEAIDAAIEIIERAESDLATAEQDSRQKQARIDRLEEALETIAIMEVAGVLKRPSLPIQTALSALEESK